MNCCIKGCEKLVRANGLCAAHYDRSRTGRDMAKPLRKVIRDGPDIDRLKAKTEIDEQTGCWLWTASLNSNGYGQIRFRGGPRPAHRVSWILHFGEIPENKGVYGTMNVLHKCGNPICVNPEHLFLGNQSDNINDAVSKDRWGKRGLTGEAHGRAIVTEDIVRAIRASDVSARKIAIVYGISAGTVQHIRKRRTWQHVK